ncbi:pyruvate dehydrogenase [Striga asiatica]|uniref:Pyruvate dehydrogenase n=1 Tax=Striga asiatica TaxID=4170 RepID=A0A5A7PNF7_STRAF|nr:pyruvate dehydrogenase [Striga asiatica]
MIGATTNSFNFVGSPPPPSRQKTKAEHLPPHPKNRLPPLLTIWKKGSHNCTNVNELEHVPILLGHGGRTLTEPILARINLVLGGGGQRVETAVRLGVEVSEHFHHGPARLCVAFLAGLEARQDVGLLVPPTVESRLDQIRDVLGFGVSEAVGYVGKDHRVGRRGPWVGKEGMFAVFRVGSV